MENIFIQIAIAVIAEVISSVILLALGPWFKRRNR